jgi:hypothetical protein
VTTIAWATPFSYALSVFWEPSLHRLGYGVVTTVASLVWNTGPVG